MYLDEVGRAKFVLLPRGDLPPNLVKEGVHPVEPAVLGVGMRKDLGHLLGHIALEPSQDACGGNIGLQAPVNMRSTRPRRKSRHTAFVGGRPRGEREEGQERGRGRREGCTTKSTAHGVCVVGRHQANQGCIAWSKSSPSAAHGTRWVWVWHDAEQYLQIGQNQAQVKSTMDLQLAEPLHDLDL